MAFFSALSAIGGLIAGASAVGASVIGGLSAAAATAASAVAGGTISAASAIASGAINAGELVLGEIISAPDLLASVASEGGNLVETAQGLISAKAGTVGEIMTGVASAGEDLGTFANGLLSEGITDLGNIASGMKTAGYNATKFLGQKAIDGSAQMSDILTAAGKAGLDVGQFGTGLVQGGITSAQDLMTAAEATDPTGRAAAMFTKGGTGNSVYDAIKKAVSVPIDVLGGVADAAGALLNAAPGVAGAAQNVAAGGAGGFGTDLLNIGSTLLQGQQAKKAAETQAAGTNRALDILEKNMATTREDLMQTRVTGRADITAGYAGAESALSPFAQTNYLNMANQYLQSPTAAIMGPGALPGAAWELEQGRKALEAGATRTSGGGLSGQQLKEASQYAINFASTKTDEALARLQPFIGMQYGAATNLANVRKEKGTTLANLGVQTVPQTAGQAQNIASTYQQLGGVEALKDLSKISTIGNIAEYLK